MRFLYNLSIYAYLLAIRIASLFNSKAKLFLQGRKNLFNDLDSRLKTNNSRLIWFHCASLGEFEQGRPVIEKIRLKDPSAKILLTFFSPSGYEIRKNYQGADFIFYLPIDTPANAKRFIERVKPSMVFFVKYEFWFNYLNELETKNIPSYLISGVFRDDHYFFKPKGAWARKQLTAFTHFYLQDTRSEELLNGIGYKNTSVSGDTRFDRVWEIAQSAKSIDVVEKFVVSKQCLIAGSSWREDEKLLSSFDFSAANFKLIIVPHEIDEAHIQSITELFGVNSTLRFSKANSTMETGKNVLIIDNIGMLSSLYRYGSIAFIGGGFGKGIHNILEAATFGIPVIFGPNYEKFIEAKELVKAGGAFSVSSADELKKCMELLSDEQVYKTASHIAKHYVQSRTGATQKILDTLK